MYEPLLELQTIDAHRWGVLLLAGAALVGNYVWFIEGLRVGSRDRLCSLPIFCTLFWFAHDFSFAIRFTTWFDTYDHWYVKLMWLGLTGNTVMELLYLRQALRYGRADLAGRPLSSRAWAAALGGGLVSALVIWATVKSLPGDDLYLVAFGLTVAVYPPFGIALMLRRGSSAGQSVLMWGAFFFVAAGWFSATTLQLGPAFRSWTWFALGAFSVTGALAGAWLCARLARADGRSLPGPRVRSGQAAP